MKAIEESGRWSDELKRKKLPIDHRLNEIAETVANNPVTIVEADTGAGKTVRIIQALLLALPKTKVWMTSLRRNAVRAISKYIAQEMQCKLGGLIGYRLAARGGKAENFTGKKTRGIMLVDASLRSKIVKKGKLPEGIIIVDEAHERTLDIDSLLGVIKALLPESPETKLVVTSATIDTKKFSEFFDNAPVISVEGRCFPVEVHEYPLGTVVSHEHHSEAVTNIAIKLVNGFAKNGELPAGPGEPMREGTVIGILPGKLDIENSVKAIQKEVNRLNCGNRIEVFGLGGWSSAQEDAAVQAPVRRGVIRFVFATEILRSQRTIPGTRIVLDSLRVKRMETNAVGGGRLTTVPVARAQADQAKGRAGRTAPGLYVPVSFQGTEYSMLEQYPKPAVLNEPMTSVCLQLAKLVSGVEGFPEIREFPFIDSPSTERIEIAISRLQKMGALDDEEKITELGDLLLQFPIDPESAMALVTADELGVLAETVISSAIRECQGISFFPRQNGDDGFWSIDQELLEILCSDQEIEFDLENLPSWAFQEGDFFKIDLDGYSWRDGARKIAVLLRKHFAGEELSDFTGQVRMYRAYKAEEARLKAIARKQNTERARQLKNKEDVIFPKFNWQKEIRVWCQGRCLKIKALQMVDGTIRQIIDDIKRSPLTLQNGIVENRDFSSDDLTKALMSGRVDNIVINTDCGYQGGIGIISLSYNAPCDNPSIALVGHPTKMDGRRGRTWYLVDEVAPIQQEWLEEILPKLFERRLTGNYTLDDQGVVWEKEQHFFLKTQVTEINIIPESSESVLRYFLNNAVVNTQNNGDISHYRIGNFVIHNQAVIDDCERLWIRSGGDFQRITMGDLVDFYMTKLPIWIRSVEDLRSALIKEVSEKDLYLPKVSDSERKKVETENPETVEVDGQTLTVVYSKDWSDNFHAKAEVENEFVYSTKVESVILPSGRQVKLLSEGQSAMTFPELVEKLLRFDCSSELDVPREEPWQKENWGWSLTETGKSFQSQLQELVSEHARDRKANDMAGRIEAFKNDALALREKSGDSYRVAETVVSQTESEISDLTDEVDDDSLREVWQKQVSTDIEKARIFLNSCDYDGVKGICESLTKTVKSNISSVQDAYTGFREIWCRRSGSNNGDGWVVCPDGSFRENDSINNPRARYQSEGYKDWLLVFPGELAISWKKGTRASEHEFKVYHLPVGGLTEAQMETLKTLLEELEEEWGGQSGLASGSASPSVGEGWIHPETGESLTPGFQTTRQKREAKLREKNKADRERALSENVPEWLIEMVSVQDEGFDRLRTFVSNVDGLNPADLDRHICLNCGRGRRYDHFAKISGLDGDDFFQGFDPNDVADWIWKRLMSGGNAQKPDGGMVASTGDEDYSDNPFSILATLKR